MYVLHIRIMGMIHTEKRVLIFKKFTNELNISLPHRAVVENTVHEKVAGKTVSKEGHADSVLKHERTHHYWFFWKRSDCK